MELKEIIIFVGSSNSKVLNISSGFYAEFFNSGGLGREPSDLHSPMRRLSVSPRKPSSIFPVGSAGGFRLNYDDETPARAIDRGGLDQKQKYGT
jgi:hypothetical protein